jgi:hypothetical protein
MSSDALPDDPGTLKAMLLAERMQNERLRQIIKELQRLGLAEGRRACPKTRCCSVSRTSSKAWLATMRRSR